MASLSETSINRPVLATILNIVVVLFGIIGFRYLGVREYPSVDTPIINVSTSYPGANADVIESQITEVLEESINGISGIRSLTSISRDGRSQVTVEFDLATDLEAAANDVRDRVSRVIARLPEDADPPSVSKSDADANPIVFVGLKSAEADLMEISDVANRLLKEKLQTIPGVSEVRIWGEKKYSIKLWMDPQLLASYQITPQDVLAALNKENVELPSGAIDGAKTELSIRTLGRLETVDQFNDLIIKQQGDRVVRFKDIGLAELGPENERTLLKNNGIPLVGVVLIPLPGSNQIAIVDEFRKRLKQIEKDLPEGYELDLGFDVTEFIRASIDEVTETIIFSFVLVVLIIFLFLRDGRSTLIPVLAIPISLIGTFFIMYLLGFSINILTLLGIVLAIGLVVDDAIVVLENIYTKIEEGQDPKAAAIAGSNEIYFAVISTTVVLCAVFLPVVFLQGLTGRLFREFGIVVAAAVVISSFVSLTLTPMLCSRLLKRKARQPWFYRVTEPFFVWLTEGYKAALLGMMQRRWLAWPLVAGCVLCIVALLRVLPSELAPQEDRNGFRLVATGPEGANFDYMEDYVNAVSEIVDTTMRQGEKKVAVAVTSPNFSAGVGLNTAFVRVILNPAEERNRSQQQIVKELSPNIQAITGARSFLVQDQSIGGGGFNSLPLQFIIQTSTLDNLRAALPRFLEAANARPEFLFVDVNLKFNKPELKVEIDRDKARNLGVSVQDVAQTMQLALAGQRFGYFVRDGKQYQILGQLKRPSRSTPADVRSLYVRNNQGELIQLDNVINTTEVSSPPVIYRYNRAVSATVQAQLRGDVSLGQGIGIMQQIADEVLDDRFVTTLGGSSRDFQESSSSLYFSFLLALILIYLVLGAQFESFFSPIVIMFTVPLALLGAAFSLWYFGQSLNIFSQIGIIMLIGLVTKNGILMVEFSNQRVQQGDAVRQAAIEGAVSRFRPVLMTSLSCILGILPIALALGAGSESRVSMGIAVVGGMTVSTLLTLFVLPPLYTYFIPKAQKPTLATA